MADTSKRSILPAGFDNLKRQAKAPAFARPGRLAHGHPDGPSGLGPAHHRPPY